MNINKLMTRAKKKKKKGDKLYPFGVQVTIPSMDTSGEEIAATVLTFKGSFDRRKLRKMLRASFVTRMKTEEIDFIIDNFATRLRPVDMDEMIAWAGTDE